MPNLEPLRQEIENLAMRLVVAEPGTGAESASAWIASLERIREAAGREGADRAAAIVSNAIEAVSHDAAGTAGGSIAELQSAIVQLQQALNGAENAPAECEKSLGQDRELMLDFILESREHLANIETQILKLERGTCDSEALNSAFRGFHTIKGLAGFLELWEIQKLAHEVEAVLDRARNSELIITPSAIDVVLESADYLRRWLAYLEASLGGGTEGQPARDESLLTRIQALSTAGPSPAPVSSGPVSVAANPGEPEAAGEVPIPEAPVPEAPAPEAVVPETSSRGRRETMAVKVDTAKLDYLVDMAGEMVIAEALVRHDPEMATVKSQRLQRNMAQMTRITAELQKTAMAMRLVPIGPLFHRMERLVRDLARQFGKSVDMVTEGDEIELDRTIVEELSDPLMHMVRNAMDHGIETPEDRVKRGKQATACVTLKAQHRAGQVVIEVGDDGRGLNREKILATAIERGLVASGDGRDDAEIFSLIFEPGFTTAAEVTNVSGRGVGMDVVRRHIEKLRGRIEIRSVPGAGTTFFLKLPLTLAIIDGLVVGVGCERYIVPMFAVREMFRPKPETLWTVQQRGEMALVRGTLLPVLRLYRRFGVTPRSEDPLQSVLVVVEVEGQRFCLVVDDLIGKQEVVIKGLGDLFKQIGGVAGGAILGDGRVGLILDVDRLYKGWVGDGSR